ncbi:MAG: RNA polymerase sigma-70 factor (subfamily 1) [Planctomycetota bacterium]|jgi:RNA polymerase sigma-70 factor (subfamily 1)
MISTSYSSRSESNGAREAESLFHNRRSYEKIAIMTDEMNETFILVRKAQSGEQEALGRLLSRYYVRVRAIVRQRLGRELRLECDSVDIMQETFQIAVKNFDNFEVRDDASMINWLATIAENRIRGLGRYVHAEKRDIRRKRALKFLGESVDEGGGVLEPVTDEPSPISVIENAETKEQLKLALKSLKPEYRTVVVHRTYSKAKWSEIAEKMGLPSKDAARQLHARAIIKLTEVIGSMKKSGD